MRFGLVECDALVAGVRAAEAARDRAGVSGVLRLFDGSRSPAHDDRKLEMLCAYAELRRALFRRFRVLTADCLVSAGYSQQQVEQIDALIDALAPGVDP